MNWQVKCIWDRTNEERTATKIKFLYGRIQCRHIHDFEIALRGAYSLKAIMVSFSLTCLSQTRQLLELTMLIMSVGVDEKNVFNGWSKGKSVLWIASLNWINSQTSPTIFSIKIGVFYALGKLCSSPFSFYFLSKSSHSCANCTHLLFLLI